MSIREKDVFISYRNEDGSNFAARLEKDLTDAGYSVYFNPNEMGASDFPKRLKDAIDSCTDFIAVCTPKYLERLKDTRDGSPNWVREELSAAYVSKRNIIPILVGNAKMPKDPKVISEDMRWFCSVDAITMPDQYLATPFTDLKNAITSRPDKDDIYKHVENSNPRFQAKSEYKEIVKALESENNEEIPESENAEAMLTAAVMSYYGFCTKRDYAAAEKWLKEISENPAQEISAEIRACADNLLAHMYYSGQLSHENQSYEKSYEYHKRASARNRNSLAEAYFAERFGIGCEFDYNKIENNYKEAVYKKFDTIAHLELAGFYETYGKWKEAAEQYLMIVHTSREAAYHLGMMYKKGVLSNPPCPDYSAAVNYLKPLVCSDYPHIEAAYELGMCYVRPVGDFPKNFTEAKRYFVIAADKNHVEAAYMAGFIFENGLAGPDVNNTANAIRYYEIAADGGQALAALQLSKLYQENNDFTNYHRAYKYAIKAVEGGVAEGNMVLGNLLLLGRGCEPDRNCAYRRYSVAAENGIYAANLMMKVIERKQKEEKTVKEVKDAYYLYDSEKEEDFKKAYDICNRYWQVDGMAANLLGLMYHHGEQHGHIVEKDDKKAVELFKKAGELGYRAGYMNLADMYFFGSGIEIDYAKAAENYKMAADMKDEEGEGDHDSEAIYGYMLYRGIGVPKDNAMAIEYLQRAAYYYVPMARYRLALIYEEEGKYDKALYNFRGAAECHVPEAYIKLVEYYRKGIGMEKPDVVEAEKWLKLAHIYGLNNDSESVKHEEKA